MPYYEGSLIVVFRDRLNLSALGQTVERLEHSGNRVYTVVAAVVTG